MLPAMTSAAGAAARETMSKVEPALPVQSAKSAPLSMLRYSPAVLLVAIAVADSLRFADPDLWGHIRFGQATLALRHLTLRDPYSYSAAGHLWRNHEWLSEVAMAAVYDAGGVFGLKLMKFAVAGLTFVFLALAEAETGASPTLQMAVLVGAAFGLAPEMQIRPQLCSFMLLAALMALLARDNYRRSARLWLAIPMLALWANLHGGFIAGIAALGTYGAIATIEDFAGGRGPRRGLRLLSIAAGATLATLLTPYGIDTWYAVAHALRNPTTRRIISDWRPLHVSLIAAWDHDMAGFIYFSFICLSMLAMAAAGARAPRAGDLPLLGVAVLMAAAALMSARNVALFVIAGAAPLTRHIAFAYRSCKTGGNESVGPTAPAARARVNPLFAAAAALALAAYTGLFSNRLGVAVVPPAGAVAFMDRHGLSGNILCNFDWGEYLIWHSWPRSRVFMDGRYDTVYPSDVIRDYVRFFFDLPGGRDVLAAYPHDFVLMPPKSGGSRVASRDPNWRLVYQDQVSALFARAGSPAAGLNGIPLTGPPGARTFP